MINFIWGIGTIIILIGFISALPKLTDGPGLLIVLDEDEQVGSQSHDRDRRIQ